MTESNESASPASGDLPTDWSLVPAEHVRGATTGLRVILYGIMAAIVLGVIGVIVVVANQRAPSRNAIHSQHTRLVLSLASLIAETATAVGTWRFTSLRVHPGAGRQGELLRMILLASVSITAANAVVLYFTQNFLVLGAFSLVGMAVLVARLVMTMQFAMGVSQAIPDRWAYRRARLYRWLLPVLGTVGVLVIIGPLVMLVLYWNLLDRVRKHLDSIAKTGKPADITGAVALG